jgi:hypothetical protein
MDQSHRQKSAVTTTLQATPTPAPGSDELTAAELTLVVGGTDGPGSLGDDGTYETAGGRTVPITVPS